MISFLGGRCYGMTFFIRHRDNRGWIVFLAWGQLWLYWIKIKGYKSNALHRAANFQTLVWDLRLFVILQTFLLLFYICLKPRLFAYPITKPPKSTLEFKNFDFILQKISVTLGKNGKNAFTQLVPPVPRQVYGSSVTLSTLRSFQTFLKYNVGNSGLCLVSHGCSLKTENWKLNTENF